MPLNSWFRNNDPIPPDTPEHPHYKIKSADTNEALGFMRDWITSVLQIETAVIGAIGAGFFLKNAPDICLDLLQKVLLMLAALAFSLSVGGAVTVLNMLPGAAQRDANSDWARERDVYSIFTNPRTRIKFYANFVARGFYIGIIFLLLFLFFRVFPDPWGSVCKMVAPHS